MLWWLDRLGVVSAVVLFAPVAVQAVHGEAWTLGPWQRVALVVSFVLGYWSSYIVAGYLPAPSKSEPGVRTIVAIGITVALVGVTRVVFDVSALSNFDVLQLLGTPRGVRSLVGLAWDATTLLAGIRLCQRRPWARHWVVGVASVEVLVGIVTPIALGEVSWVQRIRLYWALYVPTVTMILAGAALLTPWGTRALPPASRRAHWPLIAAASYAVLTGWFVSQRVFADQTARMRQERIRNAVVEPGRGTLRVRVTEGGGPLEELDGRDAWIVLRNRRDYDHHTLHTRLRNGFVEVSSVPTGIYDVHLAIDTDPRTGVGSSSVGLPGDLTSGGTVVALLLKPGAEEVVDVDTTRIIRLREPEDSLGGVVRGSMSGPLGRDLAHLASPVRFAWEPVPGARMYHARVTMRRPHEPLPITIASVQTEGTTWEVTLPQTERNAEYRFDVWAKGDEGAVGRLTIQGRDWYGFEYPFVVGTAPAYDSQVWLLLPPIVGPGEVNTEVDLGMWCIYHEYGSQPECEQAFAALRTRETDFLGFDIPHGRCARAHEARRLPRVERLRHAVKEEIARAVGTHGTVVEAPPSGAAAGAWLTVKAADGAGGSVLAIDVADGDMAASEEVLAERAAEGYAEYWWVRPSARPDGPDLVDVWRDPEPSLGRWRSHRSLVTLKMRSELGRVVMEISKTPLTLVAMPRVEVTVERLVPWRCS